MNRRQALALLSTPALAVAPSRLSMEGWIWMNLALREKRPLVDLLDDLFPTAPYAGFQNIELNDGFFAPATKTKTLELVDKYRLPMPSVYAGGVMHQDDLAEKTIEKALAIAALCKPYGCTALVTNPNPKPQGAAKTAAELATQAKNLNRFGQALKSAGFEFRVHHHNPELDNHAWEWRHILHHTDPQLVTICLDLEFVYRANLDPSALIRETGPRLTEIHLRNRINNSPLQAFEPGDIDYAAIAKTISQLKLKPLVIVELAYHDDTVITRPLKENLRLSRVYAEKLFAV